MTQRKIKVLVVDDSALVRQILVEILKTARDIEVVGTASDPYMARERIKETNPDVLTLDVEMPRMDGITFLANLMRLRPMPVVMVSSLTERGAETTLKALELGAVDFVSKPKVDVAGTLADFSDEILAKIRTAAGARVLARSSAPTGISVVPPKHSSDAILPAAGTVPTPVRRMLRTTDRIIAVGASTGGTEAILEFLIGLPADSLETIFTPFRRAANAAAANIAGLGLGLYLARRVAEQHGGRLWAASAGEGRGSEFSLWLPFADDEAEG
jgi:two-component system chemotaxis response regulator CheB